jgi:hypothetical protein
MTDEPLSTFYAIVATRSHADAILVGIYSTFEAAREKVDFEVESFQRFKQIAPPLRTRTDYLVIPVPILYVGRCK